MSVLTIFLVPSLSIVTKNSKKNGLYVAILLHVIFIAPILALQEKNVAVELKKLEKNAGKKLAAGVHSSEIESSDAATARLYGKQASVGGDKRAEGRIHLVRLLINILSATKPCYQFWPVSIVKILPKQVELLKKLVLFLF